MKVGDAVIYVDEHGQSHNALVTAVWGTPEQEDPSLNLVVVNPDDTMTDSYGRQIVRQTSQVHQSRQPAHGRYWKAA